MINDSLFYHCLYDKKWKYICTQFYWNLFVFVLVVAGLYVLVCRIEGREDPTETSSEGCWFKFCFQLVKVWSGKMWGFCRLPSGIKHLSALCRSLEHLCDCFQCSLHLCCRAHHVLFCFLHHPPDWEARLSNYLSRPKTTVSYPHREEQFLTKHQNQSKFLPSEQVFMQMLR